MSDSPFVPRRRPDILNRVRQRQALRQPLSGDEILEAERRMFAEDDEYVPQLLRDYAALLGEGAEEVSSPLDQEILSDFKVEILSPSLPVFNKPAPQRDNVLEPPVEIHKELTEFDKHHNAVRMYVIQQFEEGKKSREIAEMIGLTPHKLTRWYNQVKDLPPAMHLWTPLFHEEEVKGWDGTAVEPEIVAEELVVEERRPVLRVQEPSREAVQAAKRALKLAEKRTQLERDQETVLTWIQENTTSQEDPVVASRLAALAFHRQGWSLSQIGRALDLDVSTVSRWMTRARQAEQAEEALQKGMDKRRAELKLKAEQLAKAARVKPPVLRRQPRPKIALPRPIVPLSAMAKRSVGMLQAVLEQAETDDNAVLYLPVVSAIERERVMAILSMMDVQPDRPIPQGKGFLIPLPPEEAHFLRRMLAQG